MGIAFVVAVDGRSEDGTSAITGNIDTTGVDFFVMATARSSGAAATVSDSKSNTWNALTQTSSAGGMRAQLFWSIPTSVGSGHNFTSANGGFPGCAVIGFSGLNASPTDAEAGNSGTSLPATPGSVTAALADSLYVTGIATNSGSTSVYAIGSSYTITHQRGETGNAWGCAIAYLIQSGGPSALNPSWSLASGSAVTDIALRHASFKPAGGGGGASGQPTASRFGAIELGREGVLFVPQNHGRIQGATPSEIRHVARHTTRYRRAA